MVDAKLRAARGDLAERDGVLVAFSIFASTMGTVSVRRAKTRCWQWCVAAGWTAIVSGGLVVVVLFSPGSLPWTMSKDTEKTGSPADPGRWRHEAARINGVDLHYVTVPPDPDAVDHPTGAAPLVVLLHGFPSFWYAWRGQLDALADAGYRVVAPDMRGYNRSSAPPGVDSYRPGELVGDVRGLIEHRGAPQATVVGHDWGWLVAWETAIR